MRSFSQLIFRVACHLVVYVFILPESHRSMWHTLGGETAVIVAPVRWEPIQTRYAHSREMNGIDTSIVRHSLPDVGWELVICADPIVLVAGRNLKRRGRGGDSCDGGGVCG